MNDETSKPTRRRRKWLLAGIGLLIIAALTCVAIMRLFSGGIDPQLVGTWVSALDSRYVVTFSPDGTMALGKRRYRWWVQDGMIFKREMLSRARQWRWAQDTYQELREKLNGSWNLNAQAGAKYEISGTRLIMSDVPLDRAD